MHMNVKVDVAQVINAKNSICAEHHAIQTWTVHKCILYKKPNQMTTMMTMVLAAVTTIVREK